ncbi:helix-turn-helix domain-containing protein [Eubacteriales bacterium OttesenSCG-928-M02]|nr:helix-turn-helix domain-containing protein [Eubacteriales bacterium OttesenSCG-928-M02]
MLGVRIRSLREERNWSQKKLGEMTGYNSAMVGHVECGRKTCPSAFLIAAAEAFEMTLDELVHGEETA